jgi:phosphocarrier protein
MTATTLRETILITNANGLHLRPLSEFVAVASRYQCVVSVGRKDGPLVNGKSVLHLTSLGVMPGTEIVVETAGDDAADALQELVQVLKQTYDDE